MRHSLKKQIRRTRRFDNLDASENAFLLRQVEQIAARTYDKKYPKLYARKFVPINGSIDRGAQTYTFARYSQFGMAQLLNAYSDQLPRSDVKVTEESIQIKGMGASYGYSLQDLRAAMMANVPLDQKKANAARRGFELLVDRILAIGDTATGMVGMLNQPNALAYTVPNGASGVATWADKTPLEILADMVGICLFIPNSTGQVEEPNSLILPRTQYTQIATTPMFSVGGSDLTILEYFKRNMPQVDVGMWPKCAGIGANGTDIMMAFDKSPDAFEGVIPQEFEQLPPQQEGLNFTVPCHGRIGGVVFYYPLSQAIGAGI